MSITTTTPTTARVIVLQNAPEGPVDLTSGINGTFTFKTVPLEPLKDGQVLVKVLYFSNDPIQRSMSLTRLSTLVNPSFLVLIDKNLDDSRFHTSGVSEGDVMVGYGLGEVIASKADDLKEGQLVMGMQSIGWRDYGVLDAEGLTLITYVIRSSYANFMFSIPC